MRSRPVCLLLLIPVLFVARGSDAATLNVVGGELLGASNVNVGGMLYDVAFIDGSCETVFGGCDELSDFDFITAPDALAASQALLDQVFLDVPAGDFDTEPELTTGCTGTSRCEAWTPYAFGGFGISAGRAINREPAGGPDIANTSASATTDLFLTSLSVYAVWTPVPEPTTGALLAAGMLGLALRGRSRRSR